MHLPEIVTVWWIVWVISNYAGWLLFRRGFSEDTVSEIISNTYLAIGNDVLIILSAVLTALIIRDITKIHSARGIMIKTQGEPANPSMLIEGAGDSRGYKTTEGKVSDGQDFQSLKP